LGKKRGLKGNNLNEEFIVPMTVIAPFLPDYMGREAHIAWA
jgi:hypothetical protein